jgi:hypothetical protein
MDEFTISIPRERPFAVVAGLVVGGIAARHDVTLDALEDIQLALDSLLERAAPNGQVTIDLKIEHGTISAVVGPVSESAAGELEQEPDDSLGLRRLLDTVVDDVTLSERDGGRWVEVRKGYALAETEAGR